MKALRVLIENIVTPTLIKYMLFVSLFHLVVYAMPLSTSDTLLALYFSAIGVFLASSVYFTNIIFQRARNKIPPLLTLSGLWLVALFLATINVIAVLTNWQVITSGDFPITAWNHISTLLYSYSAWVFLVVAFDGSKR